jgi:hypothetical protein
MGASGSAHSGQVAQQPIGSFNASNYKSETDCLNAAELAHASRDACKGMKK